MSLLIDLIVSSPPPPPPAPPPLPPTSHEQSNTQKQTLQLQELQRPPSAGGPGPSGWVGEGRLGGLALEAQLLVLGRHVVPEEFQGLAHGSLGVSTKVPRMLALQNLDDGF